MVFVAVPLNSSFVVLEELRVLRVPTVVAVIRRGLKEKKRSEFEC